VTTTPPTLRGLSLAEVRLLARLTSIRHSFQRLIAARGTPVFRQCERFGPDGLASEVLGLRKPLDDMVNNVH